MPERPVLWVAGATGTTGSRVARVAHARGLPLILAGRDAEALTRLSEELGGPETRVLDLADPDGLDRALVGADVVVNCIGPFGRHSLPIAESAVRSGLPYVDPSGEPEYCLTLIHRFADAAAPLIPAVGLSSLLADLAAAISLREHGPAQTLAFAYRLRGLRPSSGTMRSTLDILGEGAVVIRDGVPHRARPGGPAVRFAVPDPLVISRYHPARSIDAYLVTPMPGVTGALLRATARGCRSPRVRRSLEVALGLLPSTTNDHPGRYSVTAFADGHRTTAWCTDVYGLAAAALVRVAVALSATDLRGVRAPSEALGDPRAAARDLDVHISPGERPLP